MPAIAPDHIPERLYPVIKALCATGVEVEHKGGMHTIEAFPASGGDGTGNLGVSNIINSVPTSGYATKQYPEINLRIEGDAAYSAVATTRADTMSVTGTYTGTSSYVYQVQVPSGATNQMQWRKFAKGATPAGAYTTAVSAVGMFGEGSTHGRSATAGSSGS